MAVLCVRSEGLLHCHLSDVLLSKILDICYSQRPTEMQGLFKKIAGRV